MIVDGKKLADNIKNELKKLVKENGARTLAVVVVGKNEVSKRYVLAKEKVAKELGVGFSVFEYTGDVVEGFLIGEIKRLNEDYAIDGIIIQLPLPTHINTDNVLESIKKEKDVDGLTANSKFNSPMVEVVREILTIGKVDLKNKNILVVGQGRLVGAPVSRWLSGLEVKFSVADINTKNLRKLTKVADVIITGAGSPRLIKKDMIKNGVVLIDAGTSEEGGKLVGDVDEGCKSVATVFTPVPGGVGPITVVMLFRNLLKT